MRALPRTKIEHVVTFAREYLKLLKELWECQGREGDTVGWFHRPSNCMPANACTDMIARAMPILQYGLGYLDHVLFLVLG